jgi:hypothetical protein
MPQYAFYSVPQNARALSFGQLFGDCWRQLHRMNKSCPNRPLLGSYAGFDCETPIADENIPEPNCLGDFTKLLSGPKPSPLRSFPTRTFIKYKCCQVHVQPATGIDFTGMLYILRECITHSRLNWAKEIGLNLSGVIEMERPSDFEAWIGFAVRHQPDIFNAMKIFWPVVEFMLIAIQRGANNFDFPAALALKDYLKERVPGDWQRFMLEEAGDCDMLIRLAALVSCGLGISACAWSKQNQMPSLVKFGQRTFLALIPNSIVHADAELSFFLIKSSQFIYDDHRWIRWALIARTSEGRHHLCLFPPDLKLRWWELVWTEVSLLF